MKETTFMTMAALGALLAAGALSVLINLSQDRSFAPTIAASQMSPAHVEASAPACAYSIAEAN